MLQKKYRLKKYSAFIATYKKNNAVSDNNVCIYFGKEKTGMNTDTKFAFVVSKKIHKRAVVRNRIKRLMRESIRLMLKENKIPFIHKYLSVICVAKQNSINCNFPDIDNTLKNLLNKKQA
jgi:ribonuclease P protein component